MYGHTAYNRTVTASPPYGGSGYAKHQSGLCPFVVFCSATFFCARKNALHFSLSGAKKTSVTAGTLCAIGFEINNHYIDK
jgi:hypothetical protein